MSEYTLSYTGAEVNELLSTVSDNHDAWDSISQAKDYIVDQGTSGIWTYAKYASGVARCWTKDVSVTLTVISEQIRSYYSFPITFLKNPNVIASPCNIGRPSWLLRGDGCFGAEALSTTQFAVCAIAGSGEAYLPITFTFAVEVIGRWK